MKTKIKIISLLIVLSISTASYAQWLKNLAKNVGGALVSAVVESTIEKYGGDPVDSYGSWKNEKDYDKKSRANKAADFTRDILGDIGMDQRNVNAGIAWNHAENNYQKANIAKDYAFNAISENAKDPETVEFLRRMTETEFNYLDDKFKATDGDQKREAINQRVLGWYDIIYDMNEVHENRQAEKRKEEKAKEQLRIEQQMKDFLGDRYNNGDADKGASFILATVNSDQLTKEEKEDYLRMFGLSQTPEEIINIVEPILKENDDDMIKQKELREKEEKERKLAEEKRKADLKAAEERRVALQSINGKIIGGFNFDVTNISEDQKSQLDVIANVLNNYPDVQILIIGHTCKIGYKRINMRKGMERAQSAKDYLVSLGVDEKRICIDSKGELEPLVPNTCIDNYKKNRRIEFQIIK